MPQCGCFGWTVLKCDLEWLCLSLVWGGRCLSQALERVELEPSWCSGATSQRSMVELCLSVAWVVGPHQRLAVGLP